MKQRSKYILFVLTLIIILSCEKWDETAEVSRISYLPEFTLYGGEFMSFVRNDTAEFTEPGFEATINGEPVSEVYSSGLGTVNLSKVGVYTISYVAGNEDGLVNSVQRIIAVTNEDVQENDLSGTYYTTSSLFGSYFESKVKKIDEKGLYKCDDVLGMTENTRMKGKFVDLGDNELVLLPGEGVYGRYISDEGSYTRSYLAWTIEFIDSPNDGYRVSAFWRKKKD